MSAEEILDIIKHNPDREFDARELMERTSHGYDSTMRNMRHLELFGLADTRYHGNTKYISKKDRGKERD